MAKTQIKLSDPRIATGVLILLAVVAGINLRTFFPKLFASEEGVAVVERGLSTPDDLGEAAARASDFLSGRDGGYLNVLGAGLTGTEPNWLCYDPFRSTGQQTSTPPGTVSPEGASTPYQLQVIGVMISDRQSLAWMDGQSRSVGDVVRGFRIESISRKGVWLTRNQQRKFLPVQSDNSAGAKYHLITQPDSSRIESGP
ncbi:MAG: hypothetical protein KOO60_07665 [Gemmatimonadales bacterium]|nr:hypothetical protein [Gemmatimonadales bacterium]